MTMDEMKAKGKCCACGAALVNDQYLNMIQILKPANWKFPIWGNFNTGHENMACAFVCDPCMDGPVAPVIKFAVQAEGDELTYHLIENL